MAEPKDQAKQNYLESQLQAFELYKSGESPELERLFQESNIEIQRSGNIKGRYENEETEFQFKLESEYQLTYLLDTTLTSQLIFVTPEFQQMMQEKVIEGKILPNSRLAQYGSYIINSPYLRTPNKSYPPYICTLAYTPIPEGYFVVSQLIHREVKAFETPKIHFLYF